MADFDLGTAKAKVVFDYSSKGLPAASRGLDNIGRETDKNNDIFQRFGKSLQHVDKQLKDLPQRKHINVKVDVDKAQKDISVLHQSLKEIKGFQLFSSLPGSGARLSGGIGQLSSLSGVLAKLSTSGKIAAVGLAATVGAILSLITAARSAIQYLGRMAKILGSGMVISAGSLLGAGGLGMIFQLAGAIKDLLGVLGAVPALVAGVATSFGTLKLATIGVSDALKEVGSYFTTGQLDWEKFGQALQSLSPSAQKFVINILDMVPALRDLKNVVQESFFAPFVDALQPLAERYLPLVQDGLSRIAGVLGSAISELAKFLDTPEAAAAFTTFLDNLVSALNVLKPAIQPLAQAFTTLISVGSEFLPQIAQIITDLANRFGAFISEAEKSGDLRNWIQTGIDSFKSLLEIVIQFGSAFGNILSVASDSSGGFLQTIADIGKQFADWTRSAEGQETLKTFFTSLSEAAKVLSPILKQVGDIFLSQIVPMLTKFGEASAPGISSFFDSLSKALDILAPEMEKMGPIMSDFMVAFGDALVEVVKQVGPELPGLLQSFVDGFKALAPYLPDLVKDLVEMFKAMQPLTGVITNIADSLKILLPLFTGFMTARSYITLFATEGASWILKLLEALGKLGQWIFGGEGLSKIGQMFVDLIGKIDFSAAWDNLTKFLSNLDNWARDLFNKGINAGKGLLEGIKQGIMSVIDTLSAPIRKVVEKLVDFLPGSPAKRGPLSGKGWSLYRGQSLVQDFAKGISQSSNKIGTAGFGLAGAAAGVFSTSGIVPNIDDLNEITQLFKHLFGLFESVSDIMFSIVNIADSLSNVFAGGSIFGPKQYKRTVSNDDLRRKREDENFSALLGQSVEHGAEQGTLKGQMTGPNQALLDLTNQSKPEDVARAIINEATKRGYSPQETQAILSTAIQESALNPMARGGGGAWWGVFQQDTSYPGRSTAIGQILGFFDRLANTQGKDIWDKIFGLQQGTPFGASNARTAYMSEIKSQWDAAGKYMANAFVQQTVGRPSALKDYDNLVSGPLAVNAANLISQLFPQIQTIGGARATGTKPNTHDVGRAIDVMIPNWDTPEGKALGDAINNWVRTNAAALGVQYTIWQDTWRDFKGNASTIGGHMNHIDIQFLDGVTASIDPNNTSLTLPFGSGLSSSPIALPDIRRGVGTGKLPGPDPLSSIDSNTAQTNTILDQWLGQQVSQDRILQQMLGVSSGGLTVSDTQANAYLQHIDSLIATQNKIDTPEGRAQTQLLQGIRSDFMSATGMGEAQTGMDVAQAIFGNVSGIVGDVFAIVDSIFKSITSAKNIGDVLARGIANTEDIFNIVENIQSFIELGARIASTVGDVLSFIGSMIPSAGGADFGGTEGAKAGLAAAAGIAQAVSAVFSTINAAIDIGQEIYRIATKYIGRFMMSWLGLGGYQGRVQYLLDTMTGELKAWGTENPQFKTTFNTLGNMLGQQYPGRPGAPSNTFYIYQGPGQDPRDTMNDAMFAVKTSGTGVFGYGA